MNRDKLPTPGLTPMQLATRRAERFEDPTDRKRFMDAFTVARVAESRGDERLYTWYRRALERDESVTVAGYIEGAASVHPNERTVF